MSLVRPSAVVTLDGQRLTSAEGAVLRVRVRLGMAPAHDQVECFCWPSSKLNSAAPGSSLAVALGDAGNETDVWTGEVSSVRLTADGIVLEGLASTIALSRTFVAQGFLDVSVADVVQLLASAAGVTVEGASGDTSLSAWGVDDSRSAWAHICDLARLVGADVTATAAGALNFVAPSSGPGGALSGAAGALSALAGGGGPPRYGASLLRWSLASRQAAGASSVAAFGAGSEQGSDKWHWILSSPNAAGSGPLRIVAAFRTRDAAGTLADALAAQASRAAGRASVVVVGDPTLRPGTTTQLQDVPSDTAGDRRILAVEHLLDGDGGFLSRLTLELAS